ncbi:MAG: hypothetical protein JO100_03700 [Pseudonocardia sp.]|nr:hypothetical protein [Pseudonocardia sp.]
MQYITQADLGVRLLMHRKEVELSDEQVTHVLDYCGRWRQRYIELVEPAAELGREIDLALMNHPPEPTRITALLDQRRSIMARAEEEFVEAWMGLDKILDRAQYSRLMEIYRREFQRLPHPVLGTGDHEPFSKIEQQIPQVVIG